METAIHVSIHGEPRRITVEDPSDVYAGPVGVAVRRDGRVEFYPWSVVQKVSVPDTNDAAARMARQWTATP